jgi:uncharacterized protein
MKIQMKDFRGDTVNQHYEEEMDPEDLDLDIGVMRFAEPVKVSADVWKGDDDLTVQVHLEGSRTFTCSLCLEEFNNPFEKDLTLHYDIKGLDGVSIDSDVREEIILDHPIRILCRPDCRGLCPTCGANLNQETCDCRSEKPGSDS